MLGELYLTDIPRYSSCPKWQLSYVLSVLWIGLEHLHNDNAFVLLCLVFTFDGALRSDPFCFTLIISIPFVVFLFCSVFCNIQFCSVPFQVLVKAALDISQ